MRLAILQTNTLIADVSRNLENIERQIRGNVHHAELFVSSEQALIGYPARDLLSQQWLLAREAAAVESLRALSRELGIGILVGHCEARSGPGRPLYNCASLFERGELVGRVRKRRVPSYDIFEEERFFEPWTGAAPAPLEFRGVRLGVSICEDGWDSVLAFGTRDARTYPDGPSPEADVLINLSASPYGLQKRPLREKTFGAMAARAATPLIYVNAVGGQDDVLFDGGSFATDAQGRVVAQAALFEEAVLIVERDGRGWKPAASAPRSFEAYDELTSALVTGLRDFVRKSGQQKVVLGVSGGIDSALCATLAARALGPENVLGVSLPSRITSDLSKDEARLLAQNLGIELRELPIAGAVDAQLNILCLQGGLALENLQSRTRGLLLTTLANDERRLVISTGNKSELAMGYATLYGDMCGAIAPIGDLYKTEVYALSHHLNRRAREGGLVPPIPELTLTRPPTAELAPDQKDSDSLPEYDILDAILQELIENQGVTVFKEESWDRLLAPRFTVADLRRRYLMQEFKRRQAAPILKVHQRSFGSGWKMPVAKGLA